MKRNIKIVAIAILVLSIYGCKPESKCNPETFEIKISDADKSKIPYNGMDTLRFIRRPQGDTFTFYGQGISPYSFTQYDVATECPNSYVKEGRKFTYVSPTFVDPIIIKQQNEINYPDNSYSFVSISFNQLSYITHSSELTSSNDSIVIENKMYYRVKKIIDDYVINPPQTQACYFNATEGILRLEQTNSEVWNILK